MKFKNETPSIMILGEFNGKRKGKLRKRFTFKNLTYISNIGRSEIENGGKQAPFSAVKRFFLY